MGTISVNNQMTLKDFESLLGSSDSNNKSFNNPARISEFVKEKIESHLQEQWGQSYQPEQKRRIFSTLENYLLKECKFTSKNYTRVEDVRTVFRTLQNNFIEAVVTDQRVNIGPIPIHDLNDEAKQILHYFLGSPFKFTTLHWNSFRAIMLVDNKDFRTYFKEHVQAYLNHCFYQLTTKDLSLDQQKFIEIFIENLLVVYPFSLPETGSTLEIPRKIDDIWEMVEYTAEVVPLTSDLIAAPLKAVGMTTDHPGAKSIFLHYPTLYPTGPGSLMGVLNNLVPFYTPGEFAYKHMGGREAIEKWIGENPDADFLGLSLGGSICLQGVCDFPTKIKKVTVYGSPAPSQKDLETYELNKVAGRAPEVEIFWNNMDYVASVGTGYHSDWNVYRFIVPIDVHSLFHHGVMSSSIKGAVMFKIDPKNERGSTERKVVNIFYKIFCIIILPLTLFAIILSTLCRAIGKVFKINSNGE